MSFFKKVLAPKITDPLAALPKSGKEAFADHPQGNATVTVQAVKSIESTKSPFVGIVFECSLQIDGEASALVGGQDGTNGVDHMVTIQTKSGEPLEAEAQGRDRSKVLRRFADAYAAEGVTLRKNGLGFLTPEGCGLVEEAMGKMTAIEGKSWRVIAWKYTGAKSSGVDYFTPDSAFPAA